MLLFTLACSLESLPPPEEARPIPPAEPEEVEEVEPEAVDEPELAEVDDELAIPVEEPEPEALPGPFGQLPVGTVAELEPLVNELSGEQVGHTGRLTLDQVVAGVPCKAGEVTVLGEGGFRCTLSLPATLSGYAFDRGTEPGFHADGAVRWLNFGDLVPPTENRLIEGVPCLSSARLHANGRVETCTLSRTATLGGVVLPKGSDVELREDGGLGWVIHYEALDLRGKRYEAGLTNFAADGSVESSSPGVFGD